MVQGAEKVFGFNPALIAKEAYATKINTKQGTQGVSYPPKYQPNYEQFDCYRSPVTSGVSGDRFDMMM